MKSSSMWSAEPVMPQSSYKKSVGSDKNCQSINAIHMQPVKSAMKSSLMWSVKCLCIMTRTVNLPRNIVMKSVKLDQCVMTRTVNLPYVCMCNQ